MPVLFVAQTLLPGLQNWANGFEVKPLFVERDYIGCHNGVQLQLGRSAMGVRVEGAGLAGLL